MSLRGKRWYHYWGQVIIPSDKDMEEKYSHMLDLLLLTGEISEQAVAMVLKFNAALGRLADERFIDKQELLSKETPEPVVG